MNKIKITIKIAPSIFHNYFWVTQSGFPTACAAAIVFISVAVVEVVDDDTKHHDVLQDNLASKTHVQPHLNGIISLDAGLLEIINKVSNKLQNIYIPLFQSKIQHVVGGVTWLSL